MKPDYSNYTINELYEAERTINKTEHPERYSEIIAEINKRENVINKINSNESDYSNVSLGELYTLAKSLDNKEQKKEHDKVIDEIRKRENLALSHKPSNSWVKTYSILIGVFGGFCVLSNITGLFGAFLFDKTNALIKQSLDEQEMDFGAFEAFFDYPDWYQSWLIVQSVLGLLIAGYIIYVSVQFFNKKANADFLMIRVLGLNILFSAVSLFLTPAVSEFAIFKIVGFVWTNMIEIIAMGYLFSKNRSVFRKPLEPVDSSPES